MTDTSLITNTVGYGIFIGLFTIILGLYGAKSWLHKKCKSLLIEYNQENGIDAQLMSDASLQQAGHTEIEIARPEKSATYFTSQILPQSTTQLQIYLSTIDHRIAAIRTPLVQAAVTVLLYTFSHSELVTNYQQENYVYNIVFHSFQLLALITFYFVSNLNPGIIEPHPAPKHKHDHSKYEEIGDYSSNHSYGGIGGHSSYQNEETEQLLENDGAADSIANGPVYAPPKGILFNQRFKATKKGSNDMETLKQTSPIEIECVWNDDATIPVSYCYNCYFLHPLRAKHCYEIGFCVARYDHYCKLIENAVGANNLRFVIMHLLLDSVVYVWQLCMSVYIIILNIGNRNNNVIGWILIVFLCGYLLISSLTRTIHLFDHIQTISKNQTISEKVDPQRTIDVLNDGYHGYDDDDREIDYHDRYFDEGFFKNWFLCFTGYRENKEYFNGIKCKLMFDEDDDGDDGPVFYQ